MSGIIPPDIDLARDNEKKRSFSYAIIFAVNSTLATPVLVLNANFAPINVCSVRRAIGLMMQDKASLVMNGRGYIQTVRNSFPVPSIIRLQYMIKRPRPIVKLSKREIFRRDGYTCQYCGQRSRRLTIDHVIPKHLGGPHTWTNLVTACSSCNHKKGGRTLERVPNMKLRSEPKEPPATAHYIFGQYLSRNEAWMDFIVGW
jgi:5-methylcytosine-specific restriction endonuclease McrA